MVHPAEVAAHDAELEKLRARIAELTAENESLREREAETERERMNLARLCVANERVLMAFDRDELVVAIQDVAANLLGAEEVAIFELMRDGDELALLGSVGIDPEPYQRIRLGVGRIGAAAERGESFVERVEGAPLTACVVARDDEAVRGVVVIFRLLPHKPRIEADERELLDQISPAIALALRRSRPPASGTSTGARP